MTEDSQKKLKVGVAGATGYVGLEFCRLIMQHPQMELCMAGSVSYAGQKLADYNPSFRGMTDLVLTDAGPDAFAASCDIVVTALPHGVSGSWVKEMYPSDAVLLDHSGDFRFKDLNKYKKAYKLEHPCPELMEKAVYGLPEQYREELKTAKLIANPGCYPTCSLTVLLPLLQKGLIDAGTIIINAYSGTSGAGRKSDPVYSLSEMGENLKPYGVVGHRHQDEIKDQLERLSGRKVNVSFTPHLAPVRRGMLASISAKAAEGIRQEDIDCVLNEYYKDETFVRVLGGGLLPQSRPLVGSNFVDVAAVLDEETGLVKMFSALDNLGKGAAAQALQALNIRFGFAETAGLPLLPQAV